MCNRVNLFKYATSELSQDAIVAWLLAWAAPKHNGPMHDLGSNFLRYIYDACQKTMPAAAKID